jgi:hypothetical protein
MITVYKVVHVVDGTKLISYYARGPYMVEYRPGEWAEAPVGGLLAFKSIKAVEAFLDMPLHTLSLVGYPIRVWRAEAEERVALPAKYSCLLDDDYKKYWMAPRLARWSHYRWPDGTVAYQKLRLLERI